MNLAQPQPQLVFYSVRWCYSDFGSLNRLVIIIHCNLGLTEMYISDHCYPLGASAWATLKTFLKGWVGGVWVDRSGKAGTKAQLSPAWAKLGNNKPERYQNN